MNKKGFTLVELLAVIVVLGLVITITATKGFGAFDNTKKAITKQNLNAIKEAANVLAEQIDNCDDDIDSELWDDNKGNLAKNNGVAYTCDALKEKMSSTDCISVTVDYLITNQYLSENKDFENLKNKNVKLCKEDKKIIINTKEIEDTTKDNTNGRNPDDTSDSDNKDKTDDSDQNSDDRDDDNKKTLVETIKTSALEGGTNRTVMGNSKIIFTSVAEENERVLNNAPDDYGISYYYRGNVLDNYVKFADKIWRIVRINGDNTVRLFLDDAISDDEGNIDKRFNNVSDSSSSNAYIGYMYGTPKSTNFQKEHSNLTDSTAKTEIDKWYVNTLKNNYSIYLADTLFCGDKTMATSGYKDHTAKGYGQIKTYYKSHERFYVNEKKNSISSVEPTFECAKGVNNTYSRYTVNSESTTRGVSVNNDLTYPIGLLSADEMIFAGTYPNITDSNGSAIYRNQNFYLYKRSENVWSMTPADFKNPSSNRFAEVFTISSDEKGALSAEIVSTYHIYTLHPVINLKENVKVESGDGTKDNPYIISL